MFRMLPPGTFITSGLRNSADFRVHVAKDKNGWTGSFPLIMSFYAPIWLVLLEPQNAEFVNVLLNLLSVVPLLACDGKQQNRFHYRFNFLSMPARLFVADMLKFS